MLISRAFLLTGLAASIGILTLGAVPVADGATLIGKPCVKVGAVIGDGPGRTLVCVAKSNKKLWQNLPPKGSAPANCLRLPEFTADFINPKYVRVVTPIGGQTGSGGVLAVRSYIFPSNEFTGQELPIYAPVAMTLTQASFYKLSEASATYKPEYSLYFDAGCGISVKFFHIKGVVGKVAKVVPTVPSESSAGQPVSATKINAGEQIGWYKLGENSVAFDFWVDNLAHTNDFIVPAHFAISNALHSVCPYDFYTSFKRTQWLAKLGAEVGPAAGTSCGVVNQGIVGTADGMWFKGPDTKTDVLSYDGFYQSQILFYTDASGTIRIGGLNSTQPIHQMRVGPESPTWGKPSDVTVGTTHCWSDDKQAVAVSVTSKLTISVIVGVGTCASLPDVSTGKTYYR
jgi:hypothetical protein